jgi:hypothetical protein
LQILFRKPQVWQRQSSHEPHHLKPTSFQGNALAFLFYPAESLIFLLSLYLKHFQENINNSVPYFSDYRDSKLNPLDTALLIHILLFFAYLES